MKDEILDSNFDDAPRLETSTYAGFWQRFAAALIDGILLGIVGQLIAYPFGYDAYSMMQAAKEGELPNLQTLNYILVALVNAVIYIVYFAYMESSEKQASFGKQALNLVVTDLNGERISFQKGVIRAVAKQIYTVLTAIGRFTTTDTTSALGSYGGILGALGSLIMLIAYCMQPFTAKKQALHDIIAGTLVFKK